MMSMASEHQRMSLCLIRRGASILQATLIRRRFSKQAAQAFKFGVPRRIIRRDGTT